MIRLATSEDAQDLGRVISQAWRASYRKELPAKVLEQATPDFFARDYLRRVEAGESALVADDASGVVGALIFGPSRDEDLVGARVVEASALYVVPDHWRKGVGRELLEAALIQQEDWEALCVWVAESNAPALSFYAVHGFFADGQERELFLLDAKIKMRRLRIALGGDSC